MELTVMILRLFILILIAFCSASISFTISFTSIFKGVRTWLSKIHPKVEELIHCPWCLNHWVTFVILIIASIDLLPITPYIVINFLLTMFTLTSISGLIHYVLLRAYEPVAKAAAGKQLEKLRRNISQ